jgi:hypothetical protein
MLKSETHSGKFSNYCTNCTVFAPAGKTEHQLTCSCEPLVGSRGAVRTTLNLGASAFSHTVSWCHC